MKTIERGRGKTMKRVLVTGAGGPAGINFVASLQAAPEKMFVVGTEANKYFVHLATTDKVYSVPKATEQCYVDSLNEIIGKEKIEFLHAQPDVEVEVLSENRERLHTRLFLPSKEAVAACQDKLAAAKLWKKRDVPVARFMELRGSSDVGKAFEELGSPIWIRATHGAGGVGSTPAGNKETAVSWMNYWKGRGVDWKFIAQEHLQGRNIAFHSLWKDGELVMSMARERLEYIYPHLAPSGVTGTPAVQKTIHDETVNKIGTDAVLSIDTGFNGIACVDMKENSEGVPCVTEINAGRMFTTSFFFSYASKILRKDFWANIPYLYVKLAFKEEIPKIPKYNVLPENVYWIRHIDAPARLVKDQKVIGEMYR
jgi:carbamoyl-phosphate synthase large subunit